MNRSIVRLWVAVLVLAAATGLMQGEVRGQQPDGPVTVTRETQDGNVREVTAPTDAALAVQPAISFIDSPSATCYKPDPGVDNCYINWYSMAVSASPNYMITMTVSLNALGPIAHTQGFFQTSMYIPYNMVGTGYKVPCGALGAGGNPRLGNAYAYTVRARDSAGLSSANYGTVYCPAQQP